MSINQIMCPACGSSDSKSTMLEIKPSGRRETTFFRCNNCRGYFNPNLSSMSDEIVHTKSTSWGGEDTGKKLSLYKLLMYNSILDLLKWHKPPPATLLDIGCSYAGFIIQAKKRGYNVYGADILPSAVDYAKSIGLNVVQASTIANINNNIPVFDLVSMLDSNYYFNNQPLELACIHNKLAENGLLIMRVVDKSLFFLIGIQIAKFLPKIGRRIAEKSVNDHLFSMPVSSLLKLLTSSGFEILYASPKGAQHSEKTSFFVKVLFCFGYWVWFCTGWYIAPGCVILAKKK